MWKGRRVHPDPVASMRPRGFHFSGRGACMESQELYSLVLARLAIAPPPYLGEYQSRTALPRRLPPIFAWLDFDGTLHLDIDHSALARICVRESISAGRPVTFGSPAVTQAVDRFRDAAATTWAATKIDQAAAVSELKSARQRASIRWRATR